MPPLMRTQRSVPNFCAGFVTAKHQLTSGVLASPTDAATNYSKSFLPDEARITRVRNFCETWRWPPSESFFSNRSRALARGLLLTSRVLEFLNSELSLIPDEIPILCEIRDSRPERETHGEAD